MSNKTVSVTIHANTEQFEKRLKKATRQSKKLSKQLKKISQAGPTFKAIPRRDDVQEAIGTSRIESYRKQCPNGCDNNAARSYRL